MRAGTHIDLSFCCKSCCFAWKKDRWGLGTIETCYSGPKDAVLHAKTTDEGWDPEILVIQLLITLFCMPKRQVMSGTHRDLLIRSKSRSFASKNHSCGLGLIKTRNSDASHSVLHAQNDRSCLGPIETLKSAPKVTVWHAKTTDKGWDI